MALGKRHCRQITTGDPDNVSIDLLKRSKLVPVALTSECIRSSDVDFTIKIIAPQSCGGTFRHFKSVTLPMANHSPRYAKGPKTLGPDYGFRS